MEPQASPDTARSYSLCLCAPRGPLLCDYPAWSARAIYSHRGYFYNGEKFYGIDHRRNPGPERTRTLFSSQHFSRGRRGHLFFILQNMDGRETQRDHGGPVSWTWLDQATYRVSRYNPFTAQDSDPTNRSVTQVFKNYPKGSWVGSIMSCSHWDLKEIRHPPGSVPLEFQMPHQGRTSEDYPLPSPL